jgi:hypothetical protein
VGCSALRQNVDIVIWHRRDQIGRIFAIRAIVYGG